MIDTGRCCDKFLEDQGDFLTRHQLLGQILVSRALGESGFIIQIHQILYLSIHDTMRSWRLRSIFARLAQRALNLSTRNILRL